MSKSKTAAAAEKAVAKSKKKDAAVLTPDELIAAARKDLAAGLFIPPNTQKLILERYDSAHALMVQYARTIESLDQENQSLRVQVADLTAKNEEFRAVYEQENRRESVRVEKTLDGQTEVVIGVETADKNADTVSMVAGVDAALNEKNPPKDAFEADIDYNAAIAQAIKDRK